MTNVRIKRNPFYRAVSNDSRWLVLVDNKTLWARSWLQAQWLAWKYNKGWQD